MHLLSTFEHNLLKHVRRDGLVVPHDRVAVAVSGGPDSVALLRVLCAWREALGLALAVVHVDHGLRGKESEDDAVFVTQLADTLGLPCFLKTLNLPRLLRERKGESVQAVAREKRYEQLRAAAEEWGATKVAVGHTQDDQMETVLMWMLRGAGLAGLSGMPARRQPCVIRPLLHVSRAELVRYLDATHCAFRMDSSNGNVRYTRNRLRRELVPLLKTFNPRIANVLSRQAAILREEHHYLDDVARAALASAGMSHSTEHVVLSRSRFLATPVPIQRRMILLAAGTVLAGSGRPGFEAVDTILRRVVHGTSGAAACFGHLNVARDYDRITFSVKPAEHERRVQPDASRRWSFPGAMHWSATGQTIEGTLQDVGDVAIRRNAVTACLDADQFSHALMIRSWKPGDYFFPDGMGGRRKKIQDFFSDTKIRRHERHTLPLVVAPEGILWVGGYRADHRFRVTDTTRRVAVIRICSE